MTDYEQLGTVVIYKHPVTGISETLFKCITANEAKKAVEYLKKLDKLIEDITNDYWNLTAEYDGLKKKDEILNDNKLFSRRLLEQNNKSLTIAVERLGESNKKYLEMITELNEENLKLQCLLEKQKG